MTNNSVSFTTDVYALPVSELTPYSLYRSNKLYIIKSILGDKPKILGRLIYPDKSA